jgi:putative membrane protein
MTPTALKIFLATIASTSFIVYAQTSTTATTTAATAPSMTDAQIVEIVKTANEGEVDLGKLGKSKAHSKDVQAFAKNMIEEHSNGEKETKETAKNAKIKGVESADSRSLKDTTKSKISDLKKLKKGDEFDKAYVDTQVTMHQSVLDTLNQKLIPSAQSADLKTLLEKTKTHVEEHLANAQKLQATLTK